MKKQMLLCFLLIGMILTVSISANKLNVPFKRLDNTEANLSEYNNGYLFVEAFATWCETCKLEMPELVKVYDYVGDKISMLSLSIDPKTDTLEKISDYKTNYNAKWEFGLDHMTIFEEMYNVKVLPTTILFDKDGKLLEIWVGYIKATKYLSDMNNYFDVLDGRKMPGDSNENNIIANSLISNPLFLFTAVFAIFNLFFIMIIKKKKKIEDTQPSTS